MSDHLRLFMQRIVLTVVMLFCSDFNYAATLSDPTLNIAQQNYIQLQDYIMLYQRALDHPWPTIITNRILKVGSTGSVIHRIRERLRATNDLPAYYDSDDDIFDDDLADAVKQFQLRHGLRDDGIVGRNTLAEMNIPPAERVKQIELNMQRWAELQPMLGNRFIMVNIPDFELYLFQNNQAVLTMKAIVGRPSRPTPELASTITRIVLNPYWNVPIRLANRDIVPKVLHNPDYLDEKHIRIFQNQADNAVPMNPDSIDWQSAAENGFPYHFRQDPGEDNSLGLVKFEFQNSKDIYLHDTPVKSLFDQDMRTYSSGCVRLEDAFALVPYLMSSSTTWDEMQMQEILASGKTTYVRAEDPIPIFITYLTAWVDNNGMLNFRPDVYGKDNPDNLQNFNDPEQPQE